MGSRKTDLSYQQRGTDPYQSSNAALVRGSLLNSLQSASLLPDGTLSQAAPPADTSVFWIDEGTDPETLKYHNGAGWVASDFNRLYHRREQNSVVKFSSVVNGTTEGASVYTGTYNRVFDNSIVIVQTNIYGGIQLDSGNNQVGAYWSQGIQSFLDGASTGVTIASHAYNSVNPPNVGTAIADSLEIPYSGNAVEISATTSGSVSLDYRITWFAVPQTNDGTVNYAASVVNTKTRDGSHYYIRELEI